MEGIYNLPVDYKIDDIDIFAYKGVKLPGTNIVLQQLSPYDWFYKYLPYMNKMLALLDNLFPGITIGDEQSTLEYRNIILVALQNKLFRRHYFGLLKKLKVIKGSIKKLMKSTKIDLFIDIFFCLYLFNTDGLKKKLKFRINQVFTQKNQISGISSTNAKKTNGCKIVEKIIRQPKHLKK